MGYDLAIGNAEIEELWDASCKTDEEKLNYDGRPCYRMSVGSMTLEDAPAFEGDPVKHTNLRSPSYTQWSEFCNVAGLTKLFYDEEEGFLRQHPGCCPILERDWRIVRDLAVQWKTTYGKEPGWNRPIDPAMRMGTVFGRSATTTLVMMGEPQEIEGEFDPVLARLLWLQWWFRWALDNCERPALANW